MSRLLAVRAALVVVVLVAAAVARLRAAAVVARRDCDAAHRHRCGECRRYQLPCKAIDHRGRPFGLATLHGRQLDPVQFDRRPLLVQAAQPRLRLLQFSGGLVE